MFEEYQDLYKLTSKTVDENIEFYKNKKSLSMQELTTLWKKLSQQAANFDKRDWTENWHNWHKHYHAFEKHKLEGKFLIQHFLTDVLEELLSRMIDQYKECVGPVAEMRTKSPKTHDGNLAQLIRSEVKLQLNEELATRKKKSKKSKK